ncbi:MAG: XRE family transcriptional regulator [Ruminococcus bromii]|nr:XRE family transcriptional regulator [Ruminococcus bromii]
MFAENLKILRERKQITQQQLADKLDISRSTIGMYENGSREPDFETLELIADFFNVNMDRLIGNLNPTDKRMIPVLGYVKAGLPIEAVENILDYEEISEDMARQGEYFALQIKGNSMEPRMREGDIVIVRKQNIVNNGDIAVVLVNGNDATVKKFFKYDSGVNLISFNPNYEPFTYTPDQVNNLPVQVIGRVVELRAKF